MKIVVAGAGAGKTTEMAEAISKIAPEEGKRIYCLAFTNSAVEHIKYKLQNSFAEIPSSFSISTLHSFLYDEFVKPYYYLLYQKQYKQISTVELSDKPSYRNLKIRDLEAKDIIHVTSIPEKAKWVIYKKSSDHQRERLIRGKIIKYFLSYCQCIYVDEAQDIDKDMQQCLKALDEAGIKITLYGDPKQDVKGYGCFRELIDSGANEVEYRTICHRCPQIHLDISNRLVAKNEAQYADSTNSTGKIRIVFESEIVSEDNCDKRYKLISDFISNESFGLKYISKKQDVFLTHGQSSNREFENLYQVIKDIWKDHRSFDSDLIVHRRSYYTAERMIQRFNGGESVESIIQSFKHAAGIDALSRKHYAELATAINASKSNDNHNGINVSSIEAIKGQEAEKCLFILTSDLTPYLLGYKTDETKTKNLLYVALTRSLNSLTVFVTNDVELKYGNVPIYTALNIATENE